MADKAGKVTIVGAGTIGPTVAYALMLKELVSEIILVNRDETKGAAKASDLSHCGPLTGGIKVRYGGFEATADSEIVVVTAGVLADKNGTRMDVLKNNIKIFKEIIPEVAKYSPDAVIIIVTNPLDAMTYVAYKLSGFPSERVIGSGTLLDTMRFRQIIGNKLGIDSSTIDAEVIGEHGDSMIPLWSRVRVSGAPLGDYLNMRKFLSAEDKREIAKETERAGWNIRLGNVHSCYGIALSAVKIIECMLGFSEDIVPVSTMLRGEYGLSDVFLSVPVQLGKRGVRKVDILDLSSDEQKLLIKSAEIVTSYIQEAEGML
ncbi:MAG: malate dehydrogenase [Clostridia bacterium]